MTVYKHRNVYWMDFRFRGERIQRSTNQSNKRIAEQIEAAYKTQLALGQFGIETQKPLPNFEKAMCRFLKWSEMEHSAHPATYDRYETSSKALLKFFGKIDLGRITPETVQKYKEWRSRQKTTRRGVVQKQLIKPATVNRELACLKKLFNYFVGEHRQLRNPVSEVKFLDEDNLQERVLTFDEERKYLAACTQPLRDVAALMLETGMRPEEVYRMLVKNVNLSTRLYFNPYGKTKAARRRIPLSDDAFEVVSRRLQSAKNGLLFPSPKDPAKPLTKLNNAHYAAIKRAKVEHFRIYDMRHTWATRAAESGMDPYSLAALLGHSKIDMVKRYAHPSEQHHLAASQRLQAFQQERRAAVEVSAKTTNKPRTQTATTGGD